LDDALDAKAKALADEHLRSCPACREELDSLKALVKDLGSIESVRAPADFLDQLHKRMERPSRVSTLREWLFYPLRVKIPLQLAGAAVMAFIIFSILSLQQPSVRQHSKPEQETKAGGRAYYMDESKEMKSDGRSEARVPKTAPVGLARDKDAGKPATRPEALVQKATIPESAKETREIALNFKRQVRAKAATAEPFPAQAPAAPAQEDKKEEALEKEPESILSITKAIQAAKGKALSVDYNPQTGLPEVIHAEMPAGELPTFYERLRELGDLRISPQTGAEKDSGVVQIKIRIDSQQ
jgi:hypothetical protein